MKRIIGSIAIAALAVLAGCSSTSINNALSSPAGQLFCAVQTDGGGTAVVGLIDAEATAAAPALGPVAVIATGAGKAQVDADCATAGKSAGGTGMAVSPPSNPAAAPQMAIVVPAAT